MYLSKRIYKAVSGPGYSFSFKKTEQPYFYDKYHHHPEYEFTFIERGSGIRIVGDRIDHFEGGEIVLLGPNLSHMWKCDPHYYQTLKQDACLSYVIHFPKQLMENILFSIPEMEPIRILFEQSKRGIKVEGPAKDKLIKRFNKMQEQTNTERFINLLEILHITATSHHKILLSQGYFSEKQEEKSSERLNDVYNYLLASLDKKVTLQKVAFIAHMSPTAFCRFFKQKTGKSFTHILNEMRINHACRLLMESNEKIAQIALSAGFSNLSHFNSQFKRITGKTPRQFVYDLEKAS